MKQVFKARFLFLDIILITFLVWLDQFTKLLAVRHLKGQSPISVIKDFLVLEYLENHGAAFGMLQNQRIFFIFIGLAFLIIMVILLLKIPTLKKYRVLRFFLCFIVAGALGNLIDRIRLDYVVDFIYIIYIHFPIFNVADIYVTVSAIAIGILVLFVYKEEDLNLKKARNPKLHSSMLTEPEEGEENKALKEEVKADEVQKEGLGGNEAQADEALAAESGSDEALEAESVADEAKVKEAEKEEALEEEDSGSKEAQDAEPKGEEDKQNAE